MQLPQGLEVCERGYAPETEKQTPGSSLGRAQIMSVNFANKLICLEVSTSEYDPRRHLVHSKAIE